MSGSAGSPVPARGAVGAAPRRPARRALRLAGPLLVAAGALASGPPALAAVAASEAGSRDDFEASFFNGLALDGFAASELDRYLNPDASGGIHERYVAGFDFAFRLRGGDPARAELWLYGETVYGVRSSDVDCRGNPELAVCRPFGSLAASGDRTLFIVRSASSLEGFAGVRWEFRSIRPRGGSPGRIYAKVQFGFLTVSGAGQDLVDVHHAALGLLSVQGRYRGSYFEVGYGRTDLFTERPDGRLKIDGYLTWHPRGFERWGASPFVQYLVDSDAGSGPDSIQTYLGFDLDLDGLFGRGLR